MSEEHEYDENIARNISPERQSSNGSLLLSVNLKVEVKGKPNFLFFIRNFIRNLFVFR